MNCRLRRLVQLVPLLALLAGCAGTRLDLTVESNIPEPVVAPLPYTLGVHYDREFRQRVFEHDSDGWRVDTRAARLVLFRAVLPAMFETVMELPAPVADQVFVDAILVPRPGTLQLAFPEVSPAGGYEAWVEYHVRLLDRDGRQLGEWSFAGYGQQPVDEVSGGRGGGVAAAVERAHRDLGARLVLDFARLEEVRERLREASVPVVAGSPATSVPGGGVPQ